MTIEAGWWSPTRTTTRSSSCSWNVVTNEIRALSEYSIDSAYKALTCPAVPEHVAGRQPLGGHAVVDRAVPKRVPVEQAWQRGPRLVRRHQIDLRHHGRVTRCHLEALEGRQRVLVRDRREAELRALVPDVVPVVVLVEAVEGPSLGPGIPVRRHVDDRPPPGPRERRGQREPVAREQLVVALLAVDPQPGVERRVGQPADPAERRRGQERAAVRRTPRRRRVVVPSSSRFLISGEKADPSTATRP